MYKVSVIMGIYNCSKTLDDAIQSLINQTFKNWKLIMCDDCSIDDTYAIAKKYSEKYDNIILLRNKENKGLNYTLNKCLKYVDTEYVARMDGDDVSLPERFEKEISFLESNREYAIVSTDMKCFDENGIWGTTNSIATPSKFDFIKGTPFCHAPAMVRTEAYQAVEGYTVAKRLLRMEDYHLWMKMYAKGYKGYNIQEALYMMRDDRNATKRRKYKYRINEAYVRFLVVKELNLSKVNLIYCFRPLIVGLLPMSIYEILHRKKINRSL